MALNIQWSYTRKYFANIDGYFWLTFPLDMCRLNFYSTAASAPLSAIIFFLFSCAVIPSQFLQLLFGLQVKLHQNYCWACKRMFTLCFRFVSKEHPPCKWLRKTVFVSKMNRFPSGIVEMSPIGKEGGIVFTRSFFLTSTTRCPFPDINFFLWKKNALLHDWKVLYVPSGSFARGLAIVI